MHEDILLFKKNIGPSVKIKAAGGIHTIADMKLFIEEGCSRIGASAAVNLLKNKTDEEI
jgi:deoxyribose-phosphate aldolase